MIAFDDRGLTLGDGLFETLLAVDGEPTAATAHLNRMTRGCAVLGLPGPDRVEAVRLMKAALAEAGLQAGRAAVRLTLTAGSGGRGLDRPEGLTPRMFATAAPAPLPTGPARLATSAVRRNTGSPASRLKTLAYLDNVLARTEAQGAGADEALMLSSDGHVACAAAANVFWARDGRLFTPSPDCGVLEGIVRAAVIARARDAGLTVVEGRFGPDVLGAAETIFLTNSLIGIRAVASLDGRQLPPSALAGSLA